MAASVSTRVVSWKEAAERNDSVAREALVMPSSTRLPMAGVPPAGNSRVVFALQSVKISTRPPGSMVGIAGILHAHLAQHLPDDNLDVLVGNTNALETVNGLHLLEQVILHALDALDLQNIVGVERAFGQLVAGLHIARPDLHLAVWLP